LYREPSLLSRDEMPVESNFKFNNLINLLWKKKVIIFVVSLLIFIAACSIIIPISIIYSNKPTGKNNLSKDFQTLNLSI
jgi:hypothetical protein